LTIQNFIADYGLVFIQWVDLNGILGRLLQEEGIEFLYYPGTAEMKEKDRKTAIDTFKQDPYVKVLVSYHQSFCQDG
jgi:SNF2 family DNA or RNA helicase